MANKLIPKRPVLATFNIQVNITGQINVPLQAASLEDALIAARAMKTHELLDAADDWNDNEHEIVGLWK